jgi:hypothetical protein
MCSIHDLVLLALKSPLPHEIERRWGPKRTAPSNAIKICERPSRDLQPIADRAVELAGTPRAADGPRRLVSCTTRQSLMSILSLRSMPILDERSLKYMLFKCGTHFHNRPRDLSVVFQ